MELPEGTRIQLLAPVIRGRKGEYAKLFEEIQKEGFARVRVDGENRELRNKIDLEKKKKHTIEVIVDRFDHEAGHPQAPDRLDRDDPASLERHRRRSWSSRARRPDAPQSERGNDEGRPGRSRTHVF